MTPGEFASGAGFEVGFERASFLLGGEADDGFHIPRTVFACVWNATFVVFL